MRQGLWRMAKVLGLAVAGGVLVDVVDWLVPADFGPLVRLPVGVVILYLSLWLVISAERGRAARHRLVLVVDPGQSFDLINPDPPCFRAGCDGHPRSRHPGCCACPRFVNFGDPEDRFHQHALPPQEDR